MLKTGIIRGWPDFEGERYKLWSYTYDYEFGRLAWIPVSGEYPKHIAEELVRGFRLRWPMIADRYDRPSDANRSRAEPLGPAWPRYLTQKVSSPSPNPEDAVREEP